MSTELEKEIDSDDEGGFMGGLFVCEDYVEKTWEFDDIKQPLLCSNMSSTDHDLTGQVCTFYRYLHTLLYNYLTYFVFILLCIYI